MVLFIWGDAYDYTEHIIITAVIATVQYLTNKGEHTILYKIHKNVYIKTQN